METSKDKDGKESEKTEINEIYEKIQQEELEM